MGNLTEYLKRPFDPPFGSDAYVEDLCYKIESEHIIKLYNYNKIQLTWDELHLIKIAYNKEKMTALQIFLTEEIIQKYKDSQL